MLSAYNDRLWLIPPEDHARALQRVYVIVAVTHSCLLLQKSVTLRRGDELGVQGPNDELQAMDYVSTEVTQSRTQHTYHPRERSSKHRVYNRVRLLGLHLRMSTLVLAD